MIPRKIGKNEKDERTAVAKRVKICSEKRSYKNDARKRTHEKQLGKRKVKEKYEREKTIRKNGT